MATSRRQIATLGTLAAVLALLLLVQTNQVPWATAPSPPPARRTPTSAQQSGAQNPAPEFGPVKLIDLERPRPAPDAGDRNPFRFHAKPAAPATPLAGPDASTNQPPSTEAPGPSLPGAPPPLPPIPLKFIGLVDAPGNTARLAVLSDGRNVFHGREGDIIDGRYRIVHVGTESIELTYVNGLGRQVIRLSGAGV